MRIDPRARAVTNSSGNGLVYDRDAFDWQGDSFACPPHDQLVIYETHIGSFMAHHGEAGDLEGLAGKLDYLVALGINAIELMPVAEFAGDYSWGYNPSNPFAVESTYGGPDLLKAFVREAHRHGIAVIVDVVLNHFGPSDLALWQFDGWSENDKGGIYFYNDERSSTPWGDTRPDYGREQVRAYLHDNALMWFDEYHMDGLRFDATLYIRTIDGLGTGDIPEGWDVMRAITASVRETRPDKILIAEDLQNDAALTTFGEGGAGFHSQWDAGFVHPVRQALTAVDDADRSMTELAEAIGADDNPFARIIYTESHDEVANGKLRLTQEIDGGDPGGWAAQKRATLGLCIALTGHGIPMIFQGQEFLEDEWFRDDVPLDWDACRAVPRHRATRPRPHLPATQRRGHVGRPHRRRLRPARTSTTRPRRSPGLVPAARRRPSSSSTQRRAARRHDADCPVPASGRCASTPTPRPTAPSSPGTRPTTSTPSTTPTRRTSRPRHRLGGRLLARRAHPRLRRGAVADRPAPNHLDGTYARVEVPRRRSGRPVVRLRARAHDSAHPTAAVGWALRRRAPGAQRSGSKGASSAGATPVTICSASRRPVTGPSVMPHMPWPPATKTFELFVAPMSGSPSAVHGREPTHSSWRWSRSAPLRSGRAASTMAWMRRWSSAASGLRNSIMPATRSRSPTGVQATRAAGK